MIAGWKDKKVLVTGGTGFLGKYLVEMLCAAGAEVLALDFRPPNWPVAGFAFIEADIRDKSKVMDACRGREVVFHLAAIPSIARAKRTIYRDINVGGTRNVLEGAFAWGVKKFVHVSSSTVYGIPAEFPLRETSPTRPLGRYGRSKLEAEEACWEFSRKGLSVSIIRPRVIIGAGRIGIFSILFDRILQGKTVYILGDGSNTFQFTNVADMADACLRAAAFEGSGLFNIGSEEILPVKEEMEALIRHAGSASRVVALPAGLARAALKALSCLGVSPLMEEQFSIADKNFRLDTSLARSRLGWQPRYSNLESIVQAFDWYAAHREEGRQYRSILGVLGRFRHSMMGGFQGRQ